MVNKDCYFYDNEENLIIGKIIGIYPDGNKTKFKLAYNNKTAITDNILINGNWTKDTSTNNR